MNVLNQIKNQIAGLTALAENANVISKLMITNQCKKLQKEYDKLNAIYQQAYKDGFNAAKHGM